MRKVCWYDKNLWPYPMLLVMLLGVLKVCN